MAPRGSEQEMLLEKCLSRVPGNCKDESDGHLGGLQLSPELQELTSGCLGKEPAEGFGAHRERCQLGHEQLQVGTGRRSCTDLGI